MNNIKISGNLEGLKESILDELDSLFDMEISKEQFVPSEIAQKMARLSNMINREIAVYINRKGIVMEVCVGDSYTVTLPQIQSRSPIYRLSGVRCLHTHPNGDAMLSAIDINSLITLNLDAMVSIGALNEKVTGIYVAIPKAQKEGEKFQINGSFQLGDIQLNNMFEAVLNIEKSFTNTGYSNDNDAERVILVGIDTGDKNEAEASLEELCELSKTVGAHVVCAVIQKRKNPDPAFFIGKGKIEELTLLRQSQNVDTVIFDVELTGTQFKNIEEILGIKVIDRTTLILDIFAKRAQSKEGKLQVELAQLNYRISHLTGMGIQLSRLGGGIGTRGPGEKKLEVDKRHIRRSILNIKKELQNISERRMQLREGRRKNEVPVVAIVGYTNAGKSTLLNKLCNADVLSEDKLFATLDTTSRLMALAPGKQVMLVDTVGFIRKLPHDLINAFKSTLEETVYADALLHVVDASSSEREKEIEVVNEILASLDALNKPVLLAMNKTDLVCEQATQFDDKAYEISAITGKGLEQLVEGILEAVVPQESEICLFVPYAEGWIVPYIHQNGRILETEYMTDGIKIRAIVKKSKLNKIEMYSE